MRTAMVVTVWTLTLTALAAQSRPPFPGTLDQHPAIDYRGSTVTDVVSVMQRDLATGARGLAADGPQGYLRSVLAQLNVPVESQVLLFSKTGIQHPFTSPENPRALYFNDRVVVGYIPGAPLIELASHDPRQGVIFQTLKQDTSPAVFARSDRCLGCHVSSNSLDVPGILVRSMSTAADGRPMPQDGSFIIDHRSPIEQRWAGWFVTGAAASVQHLGKAIDPRVDLTQYPVATSDIAALLVFDHQGHAINLLTRLGWEARVAAENGPLNLTKGDLADILNEAVDYFLFVDEAKLAAPLGGASPFARVFSASGRRDRQGRSLRELDLQSRLFKYRCSYMIESPAFDALPDEVRAAFLARLRARLTDQDTIAILDEVKAGWR